MQPLNISQPQTDRNGTNTATIRGQLFSQDPYAGLAVENYPYDLRGWGSDHPIFYKVLAEAKPRLVIEVGTWKGASAVHMARCLQALGLNADIVCVDTWLGAIEFWNDKQDADRYLALGLQNGYPTVYYQFLANVVKSGFQHVITPFPQTSLIAARWFRKRGVLADVVYIDGSHEEEDVLADLLAFWPITAPGGLLFGDDFDEHWPGIRSAVQRFARLCGLPLVVEDGKWILRKPFGWQHSPPNDEGLAARVATEVRFEIISEQLAEVIRRLRHRP